MVNNPFKAPSVMAFFINSIRSFFTRLMEYWGLGVIYLLVLGKRGVWCFLVKSGLVLVVLKITDLLTYLLGLIQETYESR